MASQKNRNKEKSLTCAAAELHTRLSEMATQLHSSIDEKQIEIEQLKEKVSCFSFLFCFQTKQQVQLEQSNVKTSELESTLNNVQAEGIAQTAASSTCIDEQKEEIRRLKAEFVLVFCALAQPNAD